MPLWGVKHASATEPVLSCGALSFQPLLLWETVWATWTEIHILPNRKRKSNKVPHLMAEPSFPHSSGITSCGEHQQGQQQHHRAWHGLRLSPKLQSLALEVRSPFIFFSDPRVCPLRAKAWSLQCSCSRWLHKPLSCPNRSCLDIRLRNDVDGNDREAKGKGKVQRRWIEAAKGRELSGSAEAVCWHMGERRGGECREGESVREGSVGETSPLPSSCI